MCRRARNALRTTLVLGLALLVLTGCVGSRPQNPEWWDTEGNRQPTPGETVRSTGATVGVCLAAGAAVLGGLWLWLHSLRDDDV